MLNQTDFPLAATDSSAALLSVDQAVLDVLSANKPLEQVLGILCQAIEREAPEALCAAHVLNHSGTHLVLGAAPSLPKEYTEVMHEMTVCGAGASFGTAAFRGCNVISADIASDPVWEGYRTITLKHDLSACCSVPVIWSGNQVLGTLSMYYRTRRGPNDLEYALLQSGSRLAGIAIERKRALEALQGQQQELQIIFDSAPIMILYKDTENRILRVNEAAAKSLGMEKRDIENHSAYEIYPREGKKYHDDDLDVIRSGKPKLGIQEPYQGFCGEQGFVVTDKVPYRDLDGNIIGVLVFARDVTQQKRAENSLREAEARFRTLVEQLPTITYIAEFGGSGIWNYVSPQIQILGFTPAEWMADPEMWKKRLHADDCVRVLGEEAISRAKGEGFVSEYRMCARDGKALWFRDEARFLRNELGEPSSMMGVLFDITDQKRMEEQLRQTYKMEAIGRLAGGIAHDFNNLLMVILGYSEILLQKIPADAAEYKSVSEITRASERAAALTRQLLAFSRRQVLKPQILAINALVSEIGGMLRRIIGVDIQLEFRLPNQVGCVKADQTQIEQVVLNLVLNARDAMPEGGLLTIETANAQLEENDVADLYPMMPGSYVLLTISDTGVGMDEQTRAHIFEPFFTTKELGKGTGLGLATVYGIVKQSGGWIWVCSEPGKGSVFKVYFPQAEGQVVTPIPTVTNVAIPRCSGTILVVDDEDGIRDLLGGYLTTQHYKVLTAKNAEEALQTARESGRPIDLLVTDLMMLKMGGYELARQMRIINPKTRVCYMSGWIEGTGLLGEIEEQMCIMKPFSLELFGEKIREILTQ